MHESEFVQNSAEPMPAETGCCECPFVRVWVEVCQKEGVRRGSQEGVRRADRREGY